MKLKIKNYIWHGYGFPVLFQEVPAFKYHGEIIADVDFHQFSKQIVEIICTKQKYAFSGNQIKFIRNYLDMSMREFAQFMDVKHQSVMRWESHTKKAAKVDINTEIIMRIKVLKKIGSSKKKIDEVLQKIDDVASLKPTLTYLKNFKPMEFNPHGLVF